MAFGDSRVTSRVAKAGSGSGDKHELCRQKTAPDKKHSPYLRVLHQRLEDSQEAEAARLFLSDVLVAAIHNEGVGIGWGRGEG